MPAKISFPRSMRFCILRRNSKNNFVFFHFWQNFENLKWPPFLKRVKLFENCRVVCQDTLWVEYFDEIALSCTVKEIEANLCFCIFGKNLKIQNGRQFWGVNFLKIAKSNLLRYPMGRKFRRNRSISHGYGDRSKLVFLYFW